jgi:hypothetical protein
VNNLVKTADRASREPTFTQLFTSPWNNFCGVKEAFSEKIGCVPGVFDIVRTECRPSSFTMASAVEILHESRLDRPMEGGQLPP